MWGERDAIIPVSHAHIAHELMPGSRLELVEDAGHFLPIERPDLVAGVLTDFIETTAGADVSLRRWQEVLTSQA
jgi:pimeloyl-ACP methyl ester carboxylesterase